MATEALTPAMVGLVADRFKVLSERARLDILHTLRDGELSVSEVVERTGLGQANTSKHLQILRSAGFIGRRKDGIRVLYTLASDDVFQLCDIVCGRIEAQAAARVRALHAA